MLVRVYSTRVRARFHRDNHTPSHRAVQTARTVRMLRRIGVASKPRKRLPRQASTKSLSLDYARELLKYTDIMRRAFAPFLAALPTILESAARERRADDMHADAGETRRIRQLIEQARRTMADTIKQADLEKLARTMMRRTSSFNRVQLGRQVKAALGADVFLADKGLAPLTEAFVDANVGLIKNIGDKLAADIESTTMRAVQTGKLHPDLAVELEDRFGFSEERAKLIARDQIGKAYGQINSARQRELGVDKFVWRTANDERVRPEHEDRDGETYSYDDPPDGELPGEPINCRCYAEPVFDSILDESAD